MSLVVVDSLRMSFGGQDVLKGASAELPRRARVGVVGPNGGGKSTLLRLIAGLEEPTGGRVIVARDVRLVYVAQEPEVDPVASVYGDAVQVFGRLRELERHVTEAAHDLATASPQDAPAAHARYDQLHHAFEAGGGYTYESAVRRTLTGLGLPEPFWSRRAAGLSGGERARLALSRALLQDPDVLLLDEPTNHLDLAAIEWLEEFLAGWPGTLLVVSHDRYFLDRIVERVWEVRDGHLDAYPGNYAAFARMRAERDLRQQQMYERQQTEIARQQAFIDRYRAGQKARQAHGRETRLARLERVEAVKTRATVKLAIDKGTRSGQVALRLNRLVVEHPGRRGEPIVTAPQSVELERGQRAAIVGPNGAGKTTLLRTIAGELAPLSGRAEEGEAIELGFFRQAAEDLYPDDDVISSFLEAKNRPLPEARDLLARFLFRGEEIFKRVGDLSGGERGRLALARLFNSGANLLLLDEPTNHLDLPSREALEEVLPSFPGAVVFVSHDRRFIDTVATHLWAIEDGALVPFVGGWTEYQRFRAKQAGAPPSGPARSMAGANGAAAANGRHNPLDTSAPPPVPRTASGRPQTRDEKRLAARVRDLEREVDDAEKALTALQSELEHAATGQDVARVRALGHAIVTAESHLQELMSAWESAAALVPG